MPTATPTQDEPATTMSWEGYPDNSSPLSTAPSVPVQGHNHNQSQSQSQPRGSFESRKWKDTVSIADSTFDESILRALCDLDCAVPLLLDRIKQSMISCREVSLYFRKRAMLEDEYGKNMLKLTRTTGEVYSTSEGKAGSFVTSWQKSLKIQETLADNRLGFAQKLSEMSDELKNLANEVDKNRKQTKDLATRYERSLIDAEIAMEKCKNRMDILADELERVIVAKEGESFKDTGVQHVKSNPAGRRALGKAVVKGGLLLKGKNPVNIQRQEDDVRQRMSSASDTYRKAVLETQTMRQEYFNFQLPRILRALKECADEVDLGTQYHLSRYAFLSESVIMSEGSALSPPQSEEVSGLRTLFEGIDNRNDFKNFMQNYAVAHVASAAGAANSSRMLKRYGPTEEGYLPPIPPHTPGSSTPSINIVEKSKPTFGVDLTDQMGRDGVDVPEVMTRCCEAIEKWGLTSQGIYRISGTVSKVSRLKDRLDRDSANVNLDEEEWTSDINVVASTMKLWLRELPDPLLTYELHSDFLDAAKIENDRLRHIRLHERVNELPDANYATLKYFLGHLHRISQHADVNNMSISNLSIVFGPTLLSPPPNTALANPSLPNGNANGSTPPTNMSDHAHWQNRAIETILEHYVDIFIDENEEETT